MNLSGQEDHAMAAARRGEIDGGVGKGVPMPASRKKGLEEDSLDEMPPEVEPGFDEFELEHDDAEPSDRRRDPLRKAGT